VTRLLITRPEEDARMLAATLASHGITCLTEPMLAIATLTGSRDALASALAAHPAAILLTSKHGALALAALHTERHIPVWAVGKITADTATALGFAHVRHAGGTAEQLMGYIRAHHRVHAGGLLYASGTEVSVDIAATLGAEGYSITALPVYRATQPRAFSPTLLDAITRQTLDGALFFSQRAAEAYVSLVGRYDVAAHHHHIRALALSDGVAAKLATLPWKETAISRTPDLEGMLALAREYF
jgi:uroporphyrinogen-III synthase